MKVTQIDCNHYKPIEWKRSYGKYATSPLWNGHPNGMKLPLHLMGKYSTTFASGFQTMSQTASALAYEFLKPQFTPRAPMGCLQYFTQPSGIIESFNFGQYLNNMDYSICIQRQPDTCRVVFTSSDYDWSLNGVGVSGASSGVGDQDCARDYLLIPGASRTGDGFTYDRYCGGRLNYYRGQALSAPVVIKTAGPIVLRFHSDGHYEGLNNGGFRLQFDQSAQDCIYHTAEESGSLASQQLLASTLADSRPLNQQLGAIFSEQPVMYSSQQLSVAPLHQLSSSSLNSNEQNHSNKIPQAESSSTPISGNKQQVEQQQQQEQVATANNIKRLDYLTSIEEPSFASSFATSADTKTQSGSSRFASSHDQPGQLAVSNSNSKADQKTNMSNKLALDLSKAFELITARSSSGWLNMKSARQSLV